MDERHKYLQFGKFTKDAPVDLIKKAKKVDKSVIDEEYIKKILRIIEKEFDPDLYEIAKTNDIRKSRLITAREVVEKRQDSCGGVATLVASVLRNLGVPTKIIHGRYIQHNPEMRHAWNEVLLDSGEWMPFDLRGKKREISKYHIREFEVLDWEEIEDRIEEI